MSFYIDTHGNYYEGDRANINDIAVPQRPTQWHSWNGTEWVPDGKVMSMAALLRISAGCEAAMAKLRSTYPDSEVMSWSQQAAEVDALATNLEAPTPMLEAMATARGISVQDLATRVRAKRDAYAVASGQIIGRRQALEDALLAIDLQAPDAAEQLEAITWPEA